MESIEYCLDVILNKLKENWDSALIVPLEADAILDQFNLTTKRHEFFKGLIKKLHKDGYVYYLSTIPDEPIPLDFYREETILTVEGYYFIENGGYTQEKINNESEKKRINDLEDVSSRLQIHQSQMATRLYWLNLAIALGAIVAGIYYLNELCCKFHLDYFCGCP